MSDSQEDGKQVWLVDRTYSDDEQNLIVLRYATEDGEQELVQEHAVTTPTGDADAEVSITADPENLRHVEDEEHREQYAQEAQRLKEERDEDESL